MDMKKHRRQAAWLCFEPCLSQAQLVQSIQILEHEFQLDGTINLMAYVAKICMQFDIELQMQKTLFNTLHKLVSQKIELSDIDPLSLLIAEQILHVEVVNNISESDTKILPDAPAYTLVFISFMRLVIDYTTDKKELFSMLSELVTDKKLKSQDLTSYIEQWVSNHYNLLWSENLSQQTLTRLVHLVYMALCEVSGPVAADDCFHKALVICEQQPESRFFSPSLFL